MKRFIFCFLFVIVTLHANSEPLSERVIVEYTTMVGFAPPQYAGVYKFEVLSNGNVQKIDNKKNVKQVAVLSQGIVNKIKFSIDSINSGELIQPEGPLCTDAPSHAINVYQSTDKKLLIWKQEHCRTYIPVDHNANNMANITKKLANIFDQIENLNTNDF